MMRQTHPVPHPSIIHFRECRRNSRPIRNPQDGSATVLARLSSETSSRRRSSKAGSPITSVALTPSRTDPAQSSAPLPVPRAETQSPPRPQTLSPKTQASPPPTHTLAPTSPDSLPHPSAESSRSPPFPSAAA